MSGVAYNPPDEVLPIYNPLNYFYETGTGISQSFADLRYLKKAGDTATGLMNFTNGILNSDGSNASPSISFINDTNTGIYRIGADNLGMAVGGSKIVDYATALVQFSQSVRVPDGTAAAPSLNFSSNSNVGLFNNAGALGLVANGVNQVNISSTFATFTNPLRLADGGFSFSSSTNTSITYTGGNRILVSNGGSQTFSFANGGVNQSNLPISLPTQTAAAPTIRGLTAGITTTGIFFKATPSLGVSVNGVERVDFTASSTSYSVPINMNNNNITNVPQVGNTAGNLELAVNSTGAGGTLTISGGTGLLSATAGGSSGNHLVITINGTAYKIALLNV